MFEPFQIVKQVLAHSHVMPQAKYHFIKLQPLHPMRGEHSNNLLPPNIFGNVQHQDTRHCGTKVDRARRMNNLERENMQLKKLVADLSLDNSILKEAASGNF